MIYQQGMRGSICVLYLVVHSIALCEAGSVLTGDDNSASDTLYYRPHDALSTYGKGDSVVPETLGKTDINRPCPCSDASLCNRIQGRAKHEVFVYGGILESQWELYDWSKITTVVEHGMHYDERICIAHKHGVRLAVLATFPTDLLTDSSYRSLWVTWMIQNVTYNFLDGVNVDFEGSVPATRLDLRKGLTELVQELSDRLRPLYPDTQITAAFPYTPTCYGRYYDYGAITNITDFVFLMDYDEPSGTPYAGANSGYSHALTGIMAYANVGVDPYKIILGVPWYGYNHECTTFNATTHNCKSGGAAAVDYGTIIQTKLPASFSGRLWDDTFKSPYLETKDPATGNVYQLWYDDAMSNGLKFQLAAKLGLRGVGVWQASGLNYSDPQQITDMWGAFP